LQPILIALFSAAAGLFSALGVASAFAFWRRKFGHREKKATIVAGCTAAGMMLSLLEIEYFVPGRVGEVIATATMLVILIVGMSAHIEPQTHPNRKILSS
jgi:hypothetical protein